MALCRTIFRFLLNQGKDFRFDQTLDGMFLSIDCWMPSLKVFHNSSIEELLTCPMMDSESLGSERAGKGLTSWLSFVVSNCEFVKCGT